MKSLEIATEIKKKKALIEIEERAKGKNSSQEKEYNHSYRKIHSIHNKINTNQNYSDIP